MNDKVRLSVCIATYNGEKYIKKQLESILYQLTAEDEIVISDDSSTDKILECDSFCGGKRFWITGIYPLYRRRS